MSAETEKIILSTIRDLSAKVDTVKEQITESRVEDEKLKGRIKVAEDYIENNKAEKSADAKYRKGMSMKIWILIIGFGLTIAFDWVTGAF